MNGAPNLFVAIFFSRFLDDDDETPLTIELAAVSNAWRKPYKQSRKFLRVNLFPINQCLLQVWPMTQFFLLFSKCQ